MIVNLHVDLETLQLIQGPGQRGAVLSLRFKRGDAAKLRVVFYENGTTPVIIGNPSGLEIQIGIKLRNQFDQSYLAQSTDWTMPAEGDDTPTYQCDLGLNTLQLNSALNVGSADELPEINLMGEITWREDGGTSTSTRTFLLVVENDVNRGTEGIPSDASPPYPLPEELELRANKGTANGYAGLDATGRIPAIHLPILQGTVALVPDDVSIFGASSLSSGAYGSNHVCSGTTANYTIHLPLTTVADTGKLIHFRMAPYGTLTRFVTLVGSIATSPFQLIDGKASRIMWAGETVTLRSTGSGWSKIAGRSVPLKGKATNISGDGAGYVQQIPTFAPTTVNLVEVEFDNSLSMVNTTVPANRINIRRSGTYSIHGCVYWNGAAGWIASRVFGRIHKNGVGIAFSESNAQAGTYPANNPSTSAELNAGDFLQLVAYQNSGAPIPLENYASCSLSVVEIPDW